MTNTFNLKAHIHGMTISTVKIGKVYETMIFDQYANEVGVYTTTHKKEAEHNHLIAVSRYAIKRNCIHSA